MIDKNKIYTQFKKNKLKIINEYQIKNKLFIVIQDKKKFKIFKYFLDHEELYDLKNEVKAYRYFSKYNFFRTPKLYAFSIKKNNLYICLEYIKGKNGNFLELNNFYNKKKIFQKKKIRFNIYLNKTISFYKSRINLKSIKLIKKLKDQIIKNKNNLKLFTTYSHGDFAKYNSIKNKSNYYMIDLEKFRERIIYYDQINWISHNILYNLSKIYTLIKFNFLKRFFLFFYKNVILIFYLIFKYFLNDKVFNFKKFCIYYIFFILEKYLICKNDYYKITNQKEKKYIKNLIFLSEILLVKLINTQFK